MQFWSFGRKLFHRPAMTFGLLLLCFALPIVWLSVAAQSDEAEESAEFFAYLPVIFTPPGPPETVRVVKFNVAPLLTCGVADIANAGDARLFVAQQDGLIHILDANGSRLAQPFLDLTSQVTQACSEQRPQAGLLGLAFHPDYANNGRFFVTYTRQSDEAIVLSRFTVSSSANVADASSEEILLVVNKPATHTVLTHNGGDMAFGADGNLYVVFGDGDVKPSLSDPLPGDSENNAQSTDTLLGKVVRLDVDAVVGRVPDCGVGGYRIPSANGLADGVGGACDEIWGLGLRAPWGVAVTANRLFVADSAEYARNEISSFLDSAAAPNFGWRCAEGSVDHSEEAHVTGCPSPDLLTAPLYEYGLGQGCRIIGGQVHGASQFTLENHYLFTDACASDKIGRIDTADPDLPVVWMAVSNLPPNLSWNASGADAAGNVYFADFSLNPTGTVNIYRVVDPQLE